MHNCSHTGYKTTDLKCLDKAFCNSENTTIKFSNECFNCEKMGHKRDGCHECQALIELSSHQAMKKRVTT